MTPVHFPPSALGRILNKRLFFKGFIRSSNFDSKPCCSTKYLPFFKKCFQKFEFHLIGRIESAGFQRCLDGLFVNSMKVPIGLRICRREPFAQIQTAANLRKESFRKSLNLWFSKSETMLVQHTAFNAVSEICLTLELWILNSVNSIRWTVFTEYAEWIVHRRINFRRRSVCPFRLPPGRQRRSLLSTNTVG